MSKTNVYLNFPGNTEEAFNHYKSIFGGDFLNLMRFKEMPNPDQPIPEHLQNKLMHVSLLVGDMNLMGADAIEGFGPPVVYGNNFSMSLTAESKEEADKFFNALSTGGNIGMPMQKTFWGDYFGMCTDKFGINWMISHTLPKE